MRPIASERNELRYPLDVLLGTKAQIRVLRFIATSDREISASEITGHTGISHPGTLKALARLEKTGFLQSTGSERSKRYALTWDSPLTVALREIFRVERDWHRDLIEDLRTIFSETTNPVDSAWLCLDDYNLGDTLEIGFLTNARLLAKTKSELRDKLLSFEQRHERPTRLIGLSRADLPNYRRADIELLAGYSPFEQHPRSSSSRAHIDLEKKSLETAKELVKLIERDPTLVSRTLEYVERFIEENPESVRTDLVEWQRILRSYSERSLREFLVQAGEHATRLRQSMPFINVLTANERRQIRKVLDSNDA